MEALARAVLDRRKAAWIVGVVAVVTGAAALLAGGVEQDDDVLAFLPADNPDVRLFYDINDRFGGLDVAMVAIEAPDIFTPPFLRTLADLTQVLSEIEQVVYAVSLVNVDDVVPDPDAGGIRYGRLVDPLPQDEHEAAQIREKVMSRDAVVGHLVSEDGDALTIYCILGPGADPKRVAGRIRQEVEAAFPAHRKYWGGAPFVSTWIYETTQADMDRLTPFAVLAVVLVLLVTFRDVRGTLLALVATGMGIATTHGLMAALHVRYNIVLSSMPVILFAVGSAYSIHVLAHFYAWEPRTGREEAIRRTLVGAGPSVIVAGLTTVVGLGSFVTMDIGPLRIFGLFTAIGILATLVLSLTFVPAVVALTGLRRRAGAWSESGPMIRLARFSGRHRLEMGLLLLALGLAAAGFTTRVRTRMDNAAFFDLGSEPDVSERFLGEEFGGSQYLQLWVRGDIKDPDVLADIRYTADMLAEVDGVGSALHVAGPLAQANEAMEGIRRLPDSREKAATLSGLMSGNQAMEQLVDDERTEALVQLGLRARRAEDLEVVLAEVERRLRERPANVPRREQVAARLAGLCRTHHVACPDRAALADLLAGSTSQASLEPDVARRIEGFLGTTEFLVVLGEGVAPRLAGALAALGPAPGTEVLAETVAQVLGLPAEAPDVGDAVFSLETPLAEIWSMARAEGVASDLLARAGVAVPAGDPGRRFLAQAAGAVSELDRPEPTQVPRIAYEVSGLPVLYRGLERSVAGNQWKSLGSSLLLVYLLLAIALRSPWSGMLATAPTVLTLGLIYGAMGLAGVSLDIGTSMLASLIVGAGVDYAVHMVAGWRVLPGEPLAAGAERAARSTAVGIWTNAIMVAAGFFVLTLGQARPLQNVGMLTATAMLIAAMTTFVAIPVLARRRSYSGRAAIEAMEAPCDRPPAATGALPAAE